MPPSDTTKDKENKAQEQQAQIQSKESQEKNGKVQQNSEGKSKKVKKDFTPPENSNVIDLT